MSRTADSRRYPHAKRGSGRRFADKLTGRLCHPQTCVSCAEPIEPIDALVVAIGHNQSTKSGGSRASAGTEVALRFPARCDTFLTPTGKD